MISAVRAVLVTVLGLALLSLVPLSTTPTASAATSRATVLKTTRFGVSYGERLSRMSATESAKVLDDAKRLGVRWVRLDFSWATVQPTGPSSYQWKRLDRVVKQARDRGLQLLPILTYSPSWARDAGCTHWTCPPHRRAVFAAFAKAAVQRYKSRGVHSWEVWNEPNLAMFWRNPDAARYAALLRTTSRAIKAADPKARVLTGGIAALENRPPSIGPRQFLTAVCDAGACGSFDAVSYHPYTYPYLASVYSTSNAWSKISQTPWSLRSILDDHGRTKTPVWVTETGAPTRGPGTASDGSKSSMLPTTTHVTEAWQAAIVTDVAAQALLNRNVRALFWYTNQDLAITDLKEASFGLRRLDGTKKPSWSAFKLAVTAAGVGG
jgi:hypothetical protein